MAHVTEEDMVLYFYGESPDPGEVGRHIEGCGECRERCEELERMLRLPLPAPEPGADYAERVWRKIEPCLPATGRARGLWWWPRWTLAAATLAIAILVAVATRPPSPIEGSHEASYRRALMELETRYHLERSERFLMESLNESEGPVTEDAEELLQANRLLRRTAEGSGMAQVAAVLEDLELVLAESANSIPREFSAGEPGHGRDVLFRVRALGDHLQTRELLHVQRH